MKKILSLMFVFCAIAIPAFANVDAEPRNWGYDFQLVDGELQNTLRQFHNELLIIITVITLFVLGLIAYISFKFSAKKNPIPSKVTHNTKLEIIWTVLPILIVVGIMIKSLNVLYYVDKAEKADLTLKVVGYQWYWGYELPDQGVAEFESRIIPTKDLKAGQPKLMEVDEPLVLPVGKTVRVLVTGDPNGVIHSWGIPSLGFKRDTVPGRVNEGWIKIKTPGVYYGYCYELCGPDHSQMPVKIVAVTDAEFKTWVESKGGKIVDTEAAASTIVEGTEASNVTGAGPKADPKNPPKNDLATEIKPTPAAVAEKGKETVEKNAANPPATQPAATKESH